VSGGCGVEDDMVEVAAQGRIRQQAGELIECRNFGGAGAGQLLLDAAHDLGRHHIADGIEDTIPIGSCGGHRINLQRRQTRHLNDGDDLMAYRLVEDLADIGSRIGTDQQHFFPASARRTAVAQANEVSLPRPCR